MQKCYVFDNSQITNRAVKCIPDFINAAYNKKFQVTNTCGSPPIEYCVHNNIHSYGDKHKTIGNRKCYVCDANDSQNSHGVEYLTDYDKNTKSPTWWQSETMEQGIDYPNSVNLTLNLGKSFEITYIRITFQSLVPESFVIYKRRHDDGEWIPYQFFSSSCEKTYDRQSQDTLTRGDDVDKAICTAEFTDIIPLSGGMIAFSTLEGRPNGQFVDIQKNLQDWVIATDIRITLNRLNSFGDQFISGDQAKNAYFYAISDIAIGGRCHCNGHAGRCKTDDNINYYCECWHNTDGVDCEKCKAGFNDAEWRPAIYGEHLGFECKQCNCNGYSNECFYDHDLFLKTGHGGHCTNCFGNRSGPNCEQCNFGYYRTETNEACIDCGCNQIGSESLQCDPTGKCKCKPGVDGQKCDRCAQNYFDLSINGCQQCSCNPTGSAHSPPICNSIDGTCQCKSNVEGKNCDKCKPGFFSLQESNIYGCFQCFCYGHSSECTSSTNYKISFIKSNDMKIIDSNWKLSNPNLKLVYDHEKNEYRVKNDNNLSINEVIYLLLPNEYLGNKRLSFNSELEIELKLENSQDSFRNMRIKDLVIENSNENLEIHGQLVPSNSFQKFTFRLNHLSNWHQRLSQERFQRLISNITSIKIRMNYNYNIEDTVIKSITLQDATLIDNFNTNDDQIATHIEQCKCPEGYTGQFCDQCKSGYKRENPSLGIV
jgi:laminin gamma 1